MRSHKSIQWKCTSNHVFFNHFLPSAEHRPTKEREKVSTSILRIRSTEWVSEKFFFCLFLFPVSKGAKRLVFSSSNIRRRRGKKEINDPSYSNFPKTTFRSSIDQICSGKKKKEKKNVILDQQQTTSFRSRPTAFSNRIVNVCLRRRWEFQMAARLF